MRQVEGQGTWGGSYNSEIQAIMNYPVAFRRVDKKIHSFLPKIDSFGGLLWIIDKKSVMTESMILQQLLSDVYKAAQQSESV